MKKFLCVVLVLLVLQACGGKSNSLTVSRGRAVTAHDFVYGWRRAIDPALASDYSYIVYSFVKNGQAYFDGASADGSLVAWSAMAEDKRLEAARGLEAQVQSRHVEALKKAIQAETNAAIKSYLEKALAAAPGRKDVRIEDVGVRAIDDRTLVVELESPTPFFLNLTCFPTYFPIPRDAVEKYGDKWTRPENLVVNGPFVLQEWVPNKHVLAERNPVYWDAAAVKQQKAKFLPIDDVNTAFNMFKAGQCDWIGGVPLEFIDVLKKDPNFHGVPTLTVEYYSFNVKTKPFDDEKVRRALALAIDREVIVSKILKGGQIPAYSIVPPGLAGYQSQEFASPSLRGEAAIKEAKRLLAEAGYPDGKGFPAAEVLYSTSESRKKMAAAIQEMWRKNLGITVELRNTEWKVYLDRLTRVDYQVARRGWVADYPDPNTFLDMFLSKSGNNNTAWADAGYDRMIQEAARTKDPRKRFDILQQAERQLMKDLPVFPICFEATQSMWRPDLHGVYDNPLNIHPLKDVVHDGGAKPFVMNIGAEVQTLDPDLARGVPEHRVISSIFEGLTTYHPKTLEPVPGVAESWTMSEDGMTWTFKLRECYWTAPQIRP